MPFTVACPRCAQSYRLKESVAGKNVKCSACGTMFTASQAAPVDVFDELEPAPPPLGNAPSQPYAYVPPLAMPVTHPPVPGGGSRPRPAGPPRSKQEASQSLVVVSVAVSGLVMVGAIVLAIVLVFSKKDEAPSLNDRIIAAATESPPTAPVQYPVVAQPTPTLMSPQSMPMGRNPNQVQVSPAPAIPEPANLASEPVPEDVDLNVRPFDWQPVSTQADRSSGLNIQTPSNMTSQPELKIERIHYFKSANYQHRAFSPAGFMKFIANRVTYNLSIKLFTLETEFSRAESELKQVFAIKEFRKTKLSKGTMNGLSCGYLRWSGIVEGERVCGYLAMGMSEESSIVCAGAFTATPASATFKYLEDMLRTAGP